MQFSNYDLFIENKNKKDNTVKAVLLGQEVLLTRDQRQKLKRQQQKQNSKLLTVITVAQTDIFRYFWSKLFFATVWNVKGTYATSDMLHKNWSDKNQRLQGVKKKILCF